MEITDEMEMQIQNTIAVISNHDDKEDVMQYIRLKLLNQAETIKTNKILYRFLYGRLDRWFKTNKAQGITFDGRPDKNDKEIVYVKLSNRLEDKRIRRIISRKRKWILWIIETWLKQC